MINEHDIKDFTDQAMDQMPEDAKKLDYIIKDEEVILDLQKFMYRYTETLVGLLQAAWGIKK